MKKYGKKLMAIIMIFVMVVAMIPGFSAGATQSDYDFSIAQPFVRTEDESGIRYVGSTGDMRVSDGDTPDDVEVITSAKEYEKLTLSDTRTKADIAQTSALPSSVDNSDSPYFPEIGNQGGLGSCQYWAQVYYQFTYSMNKSMDVATTPENTFSPQWTYNVIAGTDEAVGGYYDLYTMMQVQGNVFMTQVPYTEDVTSFYPTEDVWKTSIKYRLMDYQKFDYIGRDESIVTSPDDPDLTALKTALANGDVLSTSSYSYSWNIVKLKQNPQAPENAKFENQEVIRYVDGEEGSHRVCIVGYNDNIWTDINDNNIIDNGEMGAFKIANSWGKDWGNSGFMWVAYDSMNKVSTVDGVAPNSKRTESLDETCRIDVLEHNQDAQLYIKYTLNTSDRTQVRVSATAEKHGTPYKRQMYSNVYKGEKIAYDGSTTATDATMVGLLSNVVAGIKSEDLSQYSLSVTFSDILADDNVLTVKDAQIIDETAGKIYVMENEFPFTLDGEEKTVQFTEAIGNYAVVYYRGYDNPKIYYKTDGDDFVCDALSANIERRGYVHKYVINLEDAENAMLYFADENGNADNNNGEYYTAVNGNNFYVTQGVSTPITAEITSDVDGPVDVDCGCSFDVSASGGYAPYKYRYIVTNLDTKEQTTEEYHDYTDTTHFFRTEGTYEVAVEIMDYSDEVFVEKITVQVVDVPFSFKEMYTEKQINLVGDAVSITAVTQNERIRYAGRPANKYEFVIKDELGDTVHSSSVFCKQYDLNKRFTRTVENFTPTLSGIYTATVSCTDGNNEYAQMSISFEVFDKLLGDTDADSMITVLDATRIRLFIADLISEDAIKTELADVDKNSEISVLDATYIQRYIASLDDCASVAEVVKYEEPEQPTEPETQEPTTSKSNKVTFTNSHKWSGTISCYYWSDSNKSMVLWPGVPMTTIGANDYGETMYVFTVPQDATYIIFTDGTKQTTDISYPGGEIRYYPTQNTDNSGHYLVATW